MNKALTARTEESAKFEVKNVLARFLQVPQSSIRIEIYKASFYHATCQTIMQLTYKCKSAKFKLPVGMPKRTAEVAKETYIKIYVCDLYNGSEKCQMCKHSKAVIGKKS